MKQKRHHSGSASAALVFLRLVASVTLRGAHTESLSYNRSLTARRPCFAMKNIAKNDRGTRASTDFLKGNIMSVYDKLKALNITLPAVATPAAAYLPFVQTGKLVFLSGHIARQDGKPWVGQLGKTMGTEDGKLAARGVAIELMGTLHAALAANGQDLNQVKRIVKLMSLVNSTGDFTEQHLVTNGASELFAEVFGPSGAHARSAFGVAQIPLGACVEIELIAEVA
jgi:enamine deaminase RidA (YjgF/YER057c/UK114 family)